MRILVTKLGDELLKIMAEENLTETKQKLENILTERGKTNLHISVNRNKSNETKNGKSSSLNKSNNSKYRGDLLNKLEQDQSKIASEDLISSKIINIKQKKLNIPKNVTERYNSDIKSGLILPSVTLPKFKEESFNNALSLDGSVNIRNKFTFKDVLNDRTYMDLKNKLIKDKKIKDSLSRIDETKFRTIYGEKSNVEKLEDMLTKNINPDRINLIKYLNQKNDVSDVLIKRLTEYSEDKINKVNKICQIVFFNEERGHIYKEKIEERMVTNQNREKTEYKTSIETMGNSMKGISNILKDYEKISNKREKYRDIHNDVVNKFWRKYNVHRFEKKPKIGKSTNSIIDENANFNSLNFRQGSPDGLV